MFSSYMVGRPCRRSWGRIRRQPSSIRYQANYAGSNVMRQMRRLHSPRKSTLNHGWPRRVKRLNFVSGIYIPSTRWAAETPHTHPAILAASDPPRLVRALRTLMAVDMATHPAR